MLTRRMDSARFLGGMLLHGSYLLRLRTCLLVFLPLWAFLAAPASSQETAPASDSTRTESHDFDAGFRVYPSPLWSRSSGWAAGIGYDVRNAVLPHDRIALVAKPGQHLGRYSATYFAGDPDVQPVYGAVSAYYEDAGREWYYGVGPASSVDDQIALEKRMLDVELLAGLQLLGRRIFVQPEFSFIRHEGRDFDNWDNAADVRLSNASTRSLQAALGNLPRSMSEQRGTSFGVAAGINLQRRTGRLSRGLIMQGSGHQYRFTNPDGLEFERYMLAGYGFLELDQNVLAVRAITEWTSGPSDNVLPFYLMPTLDGRLLPGYAMNRFFGRDLFAVTIEYAVPLFQLFDFAALHGLASIGAGSVYTDIASEFEASISFDDSFPVDAETYPLRPSAGLGFELNSFTSDFWDMRVILGWSPEGIRVVKFGFVHDLQDLRLIDR